MAPGRHGRRRHYSVSGRERRTHRKGTRFAAHPRGVGTHPRRDSQLRPLLHQGDWSERTPLAYPQQRSAGNGEADAHVRTGIQGQERKLISSPLWIEQFVIMSYFSFICRNKE